MLASLVDDANMETKKKYTFRNPLIEPALHRTNAKINVGYRISVHVGLDVGKQRARSHGVKIRTKENTSPNVVVLRKKSFPRCISSFPSAEAGQ
jgi:hypothetical protein